jgi:hypothetical protein
MAGGSGGGGGTAPRWAAVRLAATTLRDGPP